MREYTGNPLKERIWEIIFKADTKEGKLFDVILLIAIIASVVVVMLETVNSLQNTYHGLFITLEWIFTIFFTMEYILRLYCVASKRKYATSFFGIIDLLSILPAFLAGFLGGSQSLLVIRGLRLLRVFRIFKMVGFLREGHLLLNALKASRQKIIVFLTFVMILVTIFGAIMYLLEAETNKAFSSIPESIYWAIVTITTVGYGDISPETPIGQFLASMLMIISYAIIAIPTGIVSAEVISIEKAKNKRRREKICEDCGASYHKLSAKYCYNCGEDIRKL